MDHALTRRDLIKSSAVAALATGMVAACGKSDAQSNNLNFQDQESQPKPLPKQAVPCVAPGIPTLPYKLDGNKKVFELTAEPVTVYFPDGSDPHGVKKRPINAWGYNGSMIGPTIEATEGDTVKIIFKNNLPDPTTVHWHGLHIPIEMDGIPDISQPMVKPGETFIYEFTLEQSGTYFYHSHVMQAKQVGLGLMGFFIIHPKQLEPWQIVDRDYAYFLQTWMIQPGSPVPDTLEMSNFNYFTMNGLPGPLITPMTAKVGEKIRIRVGNLSMMAHPIHLHGHTFKITDWGGGFLPEHQHISANTINVSAAEIRSLEFVAKRPGKWLFHCHFSHHTMNDMHRIPIPGQGGHAGHMMDMGGMHTYIEVT